MVLEDSSGEARRRVVMSQSVELLSGSTHIPCSWPQKLLPNSRRWTRARALIATPDPESLAPLDPQLRSPQLRPTDSILSGHSEESRRQIVNDVIARRTSLLRTPDQQDPVASSLPPGRLLFYFPSETVSDGASRYASCGFFDPCDCPPWEKWIQYAQGTFVSWVPEVLMPLAQQGIDNSPVECIKWAD